MNVFIIDDEPMIRRGLSNIITSFCPEWAPPRTAGSAEEALDIVDFLSTNILFLDINLPGMSGLELLEQIRLTNEDMQIIIISGFAEFSFAQRAMSLKVSNYLLKPIDVKQVFSILKESAEAVNAREAARQKVKVSAENLHSLQERVFSRILFGDRVYLPNEILTKLNEVQLIDSSFILISFSYTNEDPKSLIEHRSVQQQLYSLVKLFHLPDQNKFILDLRIGIVAILLESDSSLDNILDSLNSMSADRHYSFGFSFIHSSLIDLVIAYKESLVSSSNRIFRSHEVTYIDQTLYIDELLERKKEFSSYVRSIMNYIEDNYPNTLNLNTLAGYVHLNTGYLSELFKKETGFNLCNFINDFRISIAKTQLKQTDILVSTIAENVGFSDCHYFSQVFSKRVGVSAKNYRAAFSNPDNQNTVGSMR